MGSEPPYVPTPDHDPFDFALDWGNSVDSYVWVWDQWAAAAGEADALREALRQIMFAGCRHVWDDECARCHTFEPLKDIARAALGPSEAPTEGQGDADT